MVGDSFGEEDRARFILDNHVYLHPILLLIGCLLVPVDAYLPSLDATAAVALDGRRVYSDYLHEFSALDAVPTKEDCEFIARELPLGGVNLKGLIFSLVQQELEAALIFYRLVVC